MATIFVGGFAAIPVLGKWARHVTDVLAFLLAAAAVMVAGMYLCNRWPEYYANPRMPVAVTATPSAD